MATSGSTSVAVTSYNTLKFSWEIISQSIENNNSVVYWQLELVSGAYGAISSSASKNWNVTVNGVPYSGTNTVGIGNNTSKVLASGTTTISHNSDGTKTFSYSFSQYFGITFSGSTIGTKSGSGSGTLTTIPRKSTLAVANGTLGKALTLTVARKATTFTHTIRYSCGSYSGIIVEKSTNTSISWTPPIEFANGAPYGTQVFVEFTIETFNGSNSIGSNVGSIWCEIPSSVSPSVSFTVADAMGYLDTYGAYIQGKSKLKINVTAYGNYGSWITSYKVSANGKTYNSAIVETDVVSTSGSMTVSVSVTDSRGRTVTASKTITVLEYAIPRITSFKVERSDSTGASNPSGAYLTVTFSSEISTLNNKNGVGYGVSYKKSREETYVYHDVTAYTDNYAVTNGKYTFAAEDSSSYDVILLAADKFVQVEKRGSGSSVKKLFSVLRNGLGWAFGKIAELENTLEVAFDAVFYKDLQVDGSLLAKSKRGVVNDVGDCADYGFVLAHIPAPKTLGSRSFLPFSLSKQLGDFFTVTESGEIRVGANVSFVRITACIGGSSSTGRVWAQLRVNNQPVYGGDAIAYGSFFTANFTTIYSVKEGDLIGVYVPESFSANDGGVGCYINVERIR